MPQEELQQEAGARLACSCAVVAGGFTGTAPSAPDTGISGRCAGAVIGSGRGAGATMGSGTGSAGGGALPLMIALPATILALKETFDRMEGVDSIACRYHAGPMRIERTLVLMQYGGAPANER